MTFKSILSLLLIFQSFAFVSPAQAETTKLQLQKTGRALTASINGKCRQIFTPEDWLNKKEGGLWWKASPAVIGASATLLTFGLSTYFGHDIADITSLTADQVTLARNFVSSLFATAGIYSSIDRFYKKSGKLRSYETEKEFISQLEGWHQNSTGKNFNPEKAREFFFNTWVDIHNKSTPPMNYSVISTAFVLTVAYMFGHSLIPAFEGNLDMWSTENITQYIGAFTGIGLSAMDIKGSERRLKNREYKNITRLMSFPSEKKFIAEVTEMGQRGGWEIPPKRYLRKVYAELKAIKEQMEAKASNPKKPADAVLSAETAAEGAAQVQSGREIREQEAIRENRENIMFGDSEIVKLNEEDFISYTEKLSQELGKDFDPAKAKEKYEQLIKDSTSRDFLWRKKQASHLEIREDILTNFVLLDSFSPSGKPHLEATARPAEDQLNPAEIARLNLQEIKDRPNLAETASKDAEPAPKDQAEARPAEEQAPAEAEVKEARQESEEEKANS